MAKPRLGANTAASTAAFGDAATAGTAGSNASLADHKHGMPADPVTAHAAAADPHPAYRLESAVISMPTPIQRFYAGGAGSLPWTKPAGLAYVMIECVGGGGGGGGTQATGAGAFAAGAGGGGGGYARAFYGPTELTAATYTVFPGIGGTGGVGNATGVGGSQSSFAGTGITTVIGLGGNGGAPGLSSTGASWPAPGAGGFASGDANVLKVQGSYGTSARMMSGPLVASSGVGGAAGGLGGGASAQKVTSGNGVAGLQYGGGGGGGLQVSSSAAATNGGDGSYGVVIVTEYYLPVLT